jgi:hypothetical protein
LALVRARGERRRHEVREVQGLQGIIHEGVNLVGESAVDLESLEMNDEDRRESSE